MSEYQIINKESGKAWSTANGRMSWKKAGHAKSAWKMTYHDGDKQLESGYEIVKVLSVSEQKLLDKLKDLYVNYECGEEPDKILLECIKLVEDI